MKLRALLLSLAFLFTSLSHAEDWPRFRGPTGQGDSKETNLPLTWETETNIKWKTAIPGEGWSSPIIGKERVFLTTATEGGQSLRALCVNANDGSIVWNVEVVRQTPLRKERKNSYATPTPVTDGSNVFVVFGDGTIAALDYDGNILWKNEEHDFYSQHGLGASPILFENLLIMPFDGSSQGAEKRVGWQIPWDQSYLVALNKETGKQAWKTTRGMSRIAHVTPNIMQRDGEPLLVSSAGDVVQGYNPRTGEKLWWIYSQGEGVVPSVVLGKDLIYTASGFEIPTIRAVKPGGQGEVTTTHIAWEQTRGVPSQSSFVLVDDRLYAVTDGGIVTCYNAATGESLWQERIGGNHSASPIHADGRIYFLSESGESVVIDDGPDFKKLATNNLNERCQASPAVANGRIFIRSENNLFCIRK